MTESFDLRFSPELEAVADALSMCAGFEGPHGSTSGGKTPAHALEAACSPNKSARAADMNPASSSKLLGRGASL